MTRFLLTFVLIATMTGCSAANLSQNTDTAPEPVAAIAVEEPAAEATVADEPVQMLGIEDETDAAAAIGGASAEQRAIQRSELERIRREGEAAQGPVRNAPDYNR